MDETKAFLVRWILEFGSGPVPWSVRGRNTWYTCGGMMVDQRPQRQYFTYIAGTNDDYQLNQKGLDFIKES